MSKQKIPEIKALHDPINFHGKTFIVNTICKEDLTEIFTPLELKKLTDSDMGYIAMKLGDGLMAGYWDVLGVICSDIKTTLKERKI